MRLKYPVVGAMSLVVVALLGGCRDDGDSGKFPIALTSDRVESGERVYSQNCTACHGPVGGPPAIDLVPVHSDAGHTWHHPDRLLHQWILDRPPLATIMPAFRGTLSDEEVLDVLAYIKSSWPSDIQERQNQGSTQYEAPIVEHGSN